MKSEVRILTPSWRVTITIGLTAAVVLITAMFVFRDEFRLAIRFALALAGIVVLVLVYGWYRGRVYLNKSKHLDYLIKQEELRQMQLQSTRLELQSRFLIFGRTERAVYYENDGIRIIDALPQVVSQKTPLLPSGEPEQMPPLMPLIERESCLCFFGPRGSGKTSIALNWLSRQQGAGLIFDPKGRELNLWPERFEVISDVKQMLPAAERFMYRLERYRQARRIKPEPVLFFVDELKYLANIHGVNLLPYVINIAMFGREYNFHSGFTTQATTVKHLDIDAADLLDNFVVVHHVVEAGRYHCYVVGLDGRETEYAPPPPYPKPLLVVEDLDAPQLALPEFENDEEAAIYRAVMSNPGASFGRIAELIGASKSTHTNNKIKAVIEKFGLHDCEIGREAPMK